MDMGSHVHGLHYRTTKQHDAIMVVLEKLSKPTHFIPIKSSYKAIDVANIFIKDFF
jgi:hypothetical protein